MGARSRIGLATRRPGSRSLGHPAAGDVETWSPRRPVDVGLHSFSTWLQAEIVQLEAEDLDVCTGAAASVREARRFAQGLGCPDLVPPCRTSLLAVSVARDILACALATVDPPASGPLTVKQAAERLGVSPKTIYALIERGRLRCQRIGRAIRINPRELDSVGEDREYRHLRL